MKKNGGNTEINYHFYISDHLLRTVLNKVNIR